MYGIFTKRWFAFFSLYFIVGYTISFFIYHASIQFDHPAITILSMVFAPLWALFISYMYFHRARDDWHARFVTAFVWIGLMILLSAILVKPVYGYSWKDILNMNAIVAHWISVVGVLVGGLAAKEVIE